MPAPARYVFLFPILAAISFCSKGPAPSGQDLSGLWTLELLQCAPGEDECARRLANHRAPVTVAVPSDLRARYPWFYGQARLSRTFSRTAAQQETDQLLLIGAIGSTDLVHINGNRIGTTGLSTGAARGFFASAWNLPRSYQIPRALVAPSNRIEIDFWMLDDRAGLHRAPVKISPHASGLLPTRWLFEYLPIGILVLFVFNSIFLLILLWARLLAPGYLFFVGSSIGYIPFCAYYLPIPFEIPYLLFLQISLVGGFFTAVMNFHLFLRVFGQPFSNKEKVLCLAGVLLTLFHFAAPDLYSLARMARLYHVLVIVYLCGALFILLRLQKRNPGFKQIGFFLIPAVAGATLLNAHDLLARFKIIDSEYLFNYSAYLYVLTMNGLQSYQLILVSRKVHEVRSQMRDERDRIASDLHDVVGSELTGIIYEIESQPSAGPFASLGYRLQGTLERLRDLVYLFQLPEAEPIDLRAEIISYVKRLEKTGRFNIDLGLDADPGVDAGQALQLQRIFFEWMTNTIRHGKPRRIAIRLKRSGPSDAPRIILGIQSDGQSFRWDGRSTAGGQGLGNIARRGEALQASLRACAGKNGGSVFVLRFRVQPQTQE